MKISLYISFCFLIFIFSCKKKETDPCDAIRNEPGGFKIEELVTTYNGIEAQDTVCPNLIRFSSKRIYDSYEWFIGEEEKPRNGKSIEVLFWANLHIKVMLVGKRAPQNLCIPRDDGIDTFIRNLTVVPFDSSHALGKYQGYMTGNPTDTFTINILKKLRDDWCSTTGYYMLNMPKNSTPTQPAKYCMPRVYLAYKGLEFGDAGVIDTDVPNPVGRKDGKAQLDPDLKTIKIDFHGWKPGNDQTNDWMPMQFIGKRVQ